MSEAKEAKKEAPESETETLSEKELDEVAGGIVVQSGGLKSTQTVGASKLSGKGPLSDL